jgi:gliding motility-associated-like protein
MGFIKRHFEYIVFCIILFLSYNVTAQCPSLEAIMVNACGVAGSEQRNEFLVINSGDGFNTTDLQFSFAWQNNGGTGINNDIHINLNNPAGNPTPCSLLPGNAGLITGCPNIIPIGLGYDVPANAIVVLQTSADPDVSYDFSAVCGNGGCIYVIKNSCLRAIGAFSNHDASAGPREHVLSLISDPSCQITYIYNTTLLSGGDGDYFIPPATYGNGGCAAPPIGSVPLPTTFNPVVAPPSCGPFTLPTITGTNLTGNEAYYTGTMGTGTSYNAGDQISSSQTIYIFDPTLPCPIEISFVVNITTPPATFPAGPLVACETAPGQATFNLTALNNTITGGLGGTVSWFQNPGLTTAAAPPGAFVVTGGSTTVYAVINHGGPCPSDPEPVQLNVTTAATPTFTQLGPFCSGANFSLPTTSNNGIDGTWSPAINNTSTTLYTFTPTAGECATTTTMSVVIDMQITPTFTQLGPFCAGENFTLPGTSNNGIDGTWSPAINNMGTTLYTFTPSAGECAGTATMTVTITALTTPTFTQLGPFCAGDGFVLPTTSNNGFDGTWSPAINNMSTTLYTFTPSAGECASTTTMSVTITPLVAPVFTQIGPFCAGDNFTLPAVSNNGLTGTWSPAINNTTTTTYFFSPTTGQCASLFPMTVTINQPAVPTFSAIGPFCNGENFSLPATSNNGFTGTWSPGINPSMTTTYTFTPTAGQCATITTLQVVISSGPNATASNTGPACPGQENIQLNGGGGVSYEWSGPAGFMSSNQNPTLINPIPNAAGTYTVTVTDASGCTATATTIVTLFTEWSINTSVLNNVLCAGGQNGAISVGFTGVPALPIQDIDWTAPPGVNIMLGINNNLPPGLYAITITDNNGCTGIASLTITEPTPLVVSCMVLSNESSPGASDGSGQITVSGGTANYDIALTGPLNVNLNNVIAGTNTFNMLPPGSYIITVTDANNCANTCAFVVQAAGCDLLATIDNSENPDCFGSASGSITISASSGALPLTYVWSGNTPVGNTAVGTGLSAGTYTITVTDDDDCSAILSVTLDDPSETQFSCFENVPASGPGNADGIGSIFFSSGNAPFDLVLTGPVNGSFNNVNLGNFDFIGLIPGNYTVNVTDDNGCPATCNFTITFSNCNLSLQQSTVIPVSCFAGDDGSIEITVTGGTGNYTYAWSAAGIGNFPIANNLIAGSYTVTITDTDACELIESFVISEPDELTLNCNSTINASNAVATDGGVNLNWTGGTAPFSVQITGPVNTSSNNIGGNSVSITNQLSQGNYVVVLTDANDCQVSCDFTINSNSCNISLQSNPTQPSCEGEDDGSIIITVSGNTGTVNYNWSINPNPATPSVSGLIAGTYQVTVTDQDGCTASTAVVLTNPAGITLTCTPTAITSGNDDGMIMLTFNGGQAPYSLNYTGPVMGNIMSAGSPYNLTNLPAGTYSIVITDANGCTQSCQSTVLDPDCNVTADIDIVQNIRCAGDMDGALFVDVQGGSGNYTYSWSPATIPAVENPLSLGTGTYIVTVNDLVLNCAVVASVTLANPAPLAINCASEPTTLTGIADGILLITVSGGTLPFTVNYTGPQNGQEMMFSVGTIPIANLLDGVYNIVITDVNGCTINCSTTIEAGVCMLTVDTQINNISCAGETDGSIEIFVAGALGNVTYSWNPASIGNIPDPINLSPGSYAVTVTDQFGCSNTAVATLTDPAPFVITCSTVSNVTSIGGSDGVGRISWTSTAGPFSYIIDIAGNPVSGSTANQSFDFTGLAAGTYSVTVTNDDGCTGECSFTIDEPDCAMTVQIDQEGENLCFGDSNVRIIVSVTGFIGNLSYDFNAPVPVVPGITLGPAGTYSVTVTDDSGCTASSSMIVTQPDELTLVCSELSPASANGVADGSGLVIIAGGTAPYILRWTGPLSGTLPSASPGNFTIINIRNGIYDIEVEDANGCIAICQFTIGPDVECTDDLMIDCSVVQPASGPANPDGTIEIAWIHVGPVALNIVLPSGNPINTTASDTYTLTNAVPGNYTFYITSPDGCRDTCELTLGFEIVCDLQAMSEITQAITCAGTNTGAILVTPVGGNAPFTYAWNDGQSVQNQRSGLASGTYSFTVTDMFNCTAIGSITLNDPAPIIANYSAFGPGCNEDQGRLIITQINGGTAPYTINADPLNVTIGSTPFTVNDIEPGSYSGLITDANGCTVNLQFEIPASDNITIVAIADATVEAGNSILINVQTNRTLQQLIIAEMRFNGYLLCTNCLDFEFEPTESGIVEIRLEDDSGCAITTQFRITLQVNINVFFPSAFSPNGDGINDIFTAYGGQNVSRVTFLKMFDRWGEEIYLLEDFPPGESMGWDGSYKGKDLNPGVYIYLSEIQFLNGDKKLFAGEVTLFR